MNDLISKQAAIDAICKACSMEGDHHKCDGYPETSTWCDELVALRALPSAQPETHDKRTETHACDSISRQAAIGIMLMAIDYATDQMNKLPSAQPEIIHCRECKYHDKGSNESDSWNLCGYRPWQYVTTDDEHYCGYAKRKTDG